MTFLVRATSVGAEPAKPGADRARRAGGDTPSRRRRHLVLPALAAAALAGALWLAAPRALDSVGLLLDQNDPVRLADRMVARSLDADVARREIAAALAAGDVELAQSFVELSRARGVALDPAQVTAVEAAAAPRATALRAARNFGHGLVSGEPDDAAGVAGMLLGDLFVFGDVRDAVREGGRLVTGAEADPLVLGLAGVGLAVTAGTYASLGAGAPARAGVSVVKAALKTGRMGAGLAAWTGRVLRGAVDLPAARHAVAGAVLQPAAAARGLRAAVKLDKAKPLADLLQDAGRIQAKAGTRAAMDAMKIAEGPRDVAKAAKLAEASGGKTRAILKLGGRGAIALTTGALTLFQWSVSALLWLLWGLGLVKSLTERITRRCLAIGRQRCSRRITRAAAPGAPSPVLLRAS